MATARDRFFAQASSDESDNESGYDSEAAEVSKSTKRAVGNGRPLKRRKLSHSSASEEDSDVTDTEDTQMKGRSRTQKKITVGSEEAALEQESPDDEPETTNPASRSTARERPSKETSRAAISALPAIHNGPDLFSQPPTHDSRPLTKHTSKSAKGGKKTKTPTRPGVIYLSSLPPYLRPSALRNLLSQRGFGPISRLFLTPASKPSSSSTPTTAKSASSSSSSRKLYTEGWLEFPSHRVAKLCAQTLNATPIGGKKGGYYRDDLWNMRYLRGMAWGELMAGVAGERREEEAKRDEERREIAREQKRFVEGVERGRRWEGGEAKRRKGAKRRKMEEGAGGGGDGEVAEQAPAAIEDVQRTWRQFEAKKGGTGGSSHGAGGKRGRGSGEDEFGQEAREVLGKIF